VTIRARAANRVHRPRAILVFGMEQVRFLGLGGGRMTSRALRLGGEKSHRRDAEGAERQNVFTAETQRAQRIICGLTQRPLCLCGEKLHREVGGRFRRLRRAGRAQHDLRLPGVGGRPVLGGAHCPAGFSGGAARSHSHLSPVGCLLCCGASRAIAHRGHLRLSIIVGHLTNNDVRLDNDYARKAFHV
jgi:hypothetical protein